VKACSPGGGSTGGSPTPVPLPTRTSTPPTPCSSPTGDSGRPDYADQALASAWSVLGRSTVRGPGSLPVLVAGSWARAAPPVVNPSYFAPAAFAAVASATGDGRWAQLIESSRRIAFELTTSPSRLPPDWARIDGSGEPRAIAAPGDDRGGPRYGFDAARLLVRFAADCAPASRELVLAAGRLLPDGTDRVVAEYDLKGRPLSGDEHPHGMVAAAAVAAAPG
jgi:hypothetical protein